MSEAQLPLGLEVPQAWADRPGMFAGCVCRPGCETPYWAAHRLGSGCESCACGVWPHPSGAVEIEGEITLADGAVVRYEFVSHWLGHRELHPHLEKRGSAVSETGYRSHFGLIGEAPPTGPSREGWMDWIRAVVEHYHGEMVG